MSANTEQRKLAAILFTNRDVRLPIASSPDKTAP